MIKQKIKVTNKEIQDIKTALEKMLSTTKFERVIDAMVAITPEYKEVVSIENLTQAIKRAGNSVIDSFGHVKEDGSIDVVLADDRLEYDLYNLLLKLIFTCETSEWRWELSLDVEKKFVYPEEDF